MRWNSGEAREGEQDNVLEVLSQNGSMDKDEQYSKPSTEGVPILAAHASFFLLPSGGGEER